ncbi:MAG: hypothetical protein JOZ65_27600 [Chloroflexi bacterium]|nr:hypothetical protein [Chloroflexota bacterium]
MAHRLFGRADWLLVIGLMVSYAYFFQAGGWNQNSRFDLLRAIVEQHTTRIDDYVQNTGDRAEVNGHFYSDKAPGQALTAVPVAAAWTALVRAAGADAQAPTSQALMAYLSTIWAAGLPTTVAAVALARSARVLGASATGAAVAALGYGLASPAWAYATELWGNALTAGCLMVAFVGTLALRDCAGRHRDAWLSLLVGVACGWAVVSEYPAAPAAAILLCLALVHAGSHSRQQLLQTAVFAGLGACASMAVLVLYNSASFGSPRFISYGGIQGWPGMTEGIFGVTLPRRTVLQEILFGTFRGIVPLAPAVVLAPIGLVLLLRERANRPAVAAAAGVAIYYLLFNAAFYYWDGGATYGPRYIGAALPFFFLGLGQVWTRGARAVRWLIGFLVGVGVVLTTMAVSTSVMIPEDVGSPLIDAILPSFLHAELAQNRESFLQYGTAIPAQGLAGAWNLGQLVGLPGLWSLLPLLLLWIVCLSVGLNFRTRRKCW